MRRRCGFTIVELLVVIGIIAILIAILIPAVQSVRAGAMQAKCLSNIKQLTGALISYTQNYEGRFPRPAGGGPYARPEDWIYFDGRPVSQSRILPYISSLKVLVCPADDTNFRPRQPGLYHYSYSVNEKVCHTPQPPLSAPPTSPPGQDSPLDVPTMSITQIVSPSSKILVIDESAITIDDGCWAGQEDYGRCFYAQGQNPADGFNELSVRHTQSKEQPGNFNAGKGCVGFCDGHADMIERIDSWNPKYYNPLLN